MKRIIILLTIFLISCASTKGLHSYQKPERLSIIFDKDNPYSYCIEPPIPALVITDFKSKNLVHATDSVNVESSVNYDEELNQIYNLNNENLLMQYAMYRLCEMYINFNNLDENARKEYVKQFSKIFDAVQELMRTKTNEENNRTLNIQYKIIRLQYDVLNQKLKNTSLETEKQEIVKKLDAINQELEGLKTNANNGH